MSRKKGGGVKWIWNKTIVIWEILGLVVELKQYLFNKSMVMFLPNKAKNWPRWKAYETSRILDSILDKKWVCIWLWESIFKNLDLVFFIADIMPLSTELMNIIFAIFVYTNKACVIVWDIFFSNQSDIYCSDQLFLRQNSVHFDQ